MNPATVESILVGRSAAIQRLRAHIVRFAPTRLPALIQGPTGSGKELVARALHVASGRRGAFVAFNVCALSDTMFEDALFGHVRGAFTGAMSDRAGYLAEANGGTVLLDEIGGTATTSQAKLLRAIETGSFRAVGAGIDRVSDFRVVAASNEPLDSLVVVGSFRRDLLHRLAGVLLEVPPLSARPEDVVPLAEHFLAALQASFPHKLSKQAADCLCEHSWPGNVRELKHTVERAAIVADSQLIEREHVEQSLLTRRQELSREGMVGDSTERRDLLRALLENEWDTTKVAARLGVHRATVYRRMRQLRIDSREGGADSITPANSLLA
jgi:DNA-binding NtrC family response regulator